MQRSALCRSRRELSNEYLLAKIGVDTAENEPLEVYICKPKFVTCITCNVTCNTCNENLHVNKAKLRKFMVNFQDYCATNRLQTFSHPLPSCFLFLSFRVSIVKYNWTYVVYNFKGTQKISINDVPLLWGNLAAQSGFSAERHSSPDFCLQAQRCWERPRGRRYGLAATRTHFHFLRKRRQWNQMSCNSE